MPMHWQRRLWRGTNNTDIVAAAIARAIPAASLRTVLSRSRNTLAQKELHLKQRFTNMRGAFRIGAGYHLQGIRVLLVRRCFDLRSHL